MPNVRCRFYDDSGAPINGGCRKGSDCDFVHPSHPRWQHARKPNTSFQHDRTRQNFPPKDNQGGGSGSTRDWDWNSGRKNERANAHSGVGGAGPSTHSNSVPIGRRRQDESAGMSGWGPGPIGGTDWPNGNESPSRPNLDINTNLPMNTADVAPASPGNWGAPNQDVSGDWGAPSADDPGGWGTPPPANPMGVQSDPAPQKSPERGEEENYIWSNAKGKGKEAESAPTPRSGLSTPAYGLTTPRTPHSPTRSPLRDPRRRPPTTSATPVVAMPSDDQAPAVNVAKEMQKESYEMRLSSIGIPVRTALAGKEGASASTSKSNPFAFPEYTRVEKKVSPSESVPGVADEREPFVDMMEVDFGSCPSSPASQARERELPAGLKAQWKDFVRTLSRIISLQLETKKLENTRENQRRMQHSPQYQNASLVAAHSKIEKLREENDGKMHKAQKRLDECLQKLMRYPLQGLPTPSNDDPRENEVGEVRGYVAEVNAWMDQIRPVVEEYQKVLRRTEEKRHQEEEERKKAEDARAALKMDSKRWAPITLAAIDPNEEKMERLLSNAEKAEERVTDLEYYFDELRANAQKVEDAISEGLVERGLRRQPLASQPSQWSVEDGEVPYEPPPPPKTREELTEDVDRLQRLIRQYNDQVTRGMQQLEEQRQRNLTKDRSYHELAMDNVELKIEVKSLIETREQDSKQVGKLDEDIAGLRAMLEKCQAEQPPPPPPPPSAEEITAQIMSTVLPDLQGAVQIGLGRLKSGVQETMQRQEEAICRQLVAVLYPAMTIVKHVKPIMDRQASEMQQMPPPPLPVQNVQRS